VGQPQVANGQRRTANDKYKNQADPREPCGAKQKNLTDDRFEPKTLQKRDKRARRMWYGEFPIKKYTWIGEQRK